MVKTLFMIIFCSILGIQLINGLKCYVCDTTACLQPGDADKKDCSETGTDALSGKAFVNNAVGKDYVALANDLTTEVKRRNLNDTVITWDKMTEMACYTSKDKHRGCFVAAKGYCTNGKNLFGQATAAGDKATALTKNLNKAVTSIFAAFGADFNVTTADKEGITTWLADNYMAKIFTTSATAQYQMEYCCNDDSCNLASMVQTSIVVLSIPLLSIFLLV